MGCVMALLGLVIVLWTLWKIWKRMSVRSLDAENLVSMNVRVPSDPETTTTTTFPPLESSESYLRCQIT